MTIEKDLIRAGRPGRVGFKALIDAAIDLLFPPRCVACGSLGSWLCASCVSEIKPIRPPLCQRCGLPLEASPAGRPAPLRCSRCRQLPQEWEALLAYGFHQEALRTAIHQFKYEDLRCLAPLLGGLMAEGWGRLAPDGWQPDVIVPIPLHPSRQRQRGYNQSALLARELGAHLGCPVETKALMRVRATAPQVGLGLDERRTNVRGAFDCRDGRLRGKKVLLIDDVCTTGSTLESACLAMKESGATSVLAYTLARARSSGPDT
ncbi:MAG: ComF family protein [Anaerolineae bacterium]